MGLDVYGSLIVGVHITEADLFTVTKEPTTKCDECELDLKEGRKFCSHCGHEFKKVRVKRPTEGLKALLIKEGIEIPDKMNVRYLEGLVYNSRSHQSYEDNDDHLVLGIEVQSTGSNRSSDCSPLPVSWPALEKTRSKVIKMARTMGLKDVEVNCYITIQYSY